MEGGLLGDALEELVEGLWCDHGGIAKEFEFLSTVSTCWRVKERRCAYGLDGPDAAVHLRLVHLLRGDHYGGTYKVREEVVQRKGVSSQDGERVRC